jgi:hypothetical protein
MDLVMSVIFLFKDNCFSCVKISLTTVKSVCNSALYLKTCQFFFFFCNFYVMQLQ